MAEKNEDDDGNKRKARSPLAKEVSKIQKHLHVSILSADVLTTGVEPVSRTLMLEQSETMEQRLSNLEQRVAGISDLEKRVETLEEELRKSYSELLTVRQENAGLQLKICQLAAAEDESTPSSGEDSSVAPSSPGSPMETNGTIPTVNSLNAQGSVLLSRYSSPGVPADAQGNSAIRPQPGSADPVPGMAPLHPSCEAKAKKLLLGLNNTKTLPKHATTLLIGDSLVHCINKQDCPDSLRVRSVGGLCISAFVRALKQRKRPLGGVKRLLLSLGVNDYLHRANHCRDDMEETFKAMGVEAKRVFPNAAVYYVLPYKGITKVTLQDMQELEKLVRSNCKRFKVFTPPSLVNLVSVGGVHAKKQGAKLLTEFYRKLVHVPPKTFSQDSGRQGQFPTYSAAAAFDQTSPPDVWGPQQQQRQWRPAPNNPSYLGQPLPSNAAPPTIHEFPGSSDHNRNLAWDIASAVVSAFQQRDYRRMCPK
jgi:hypothetical protein